ncbi:MAG: ABC transporter permease [Acidobacteria bacterium]|nr:ABC transporter permease [Acidobacteriota bacterium]
MNKMFAVFKREYLQAVRKKSFIILTVLMPVLFAGIILLPALLLGKTMEKKTVMVVDGTGRLQDTLQGGVEPLASEEPGSESEEMARDLEDQSGPIETRYVDASHAADLKEFAEPHIARMGSKDEDESERIDAVLIVPRGAFEASDEPMTYYSRSKTDLIARERLARQINREIQRERLLGRGVPADQIDSVLDRLDVNSVQVTKSGEEKKGGEMDFMIAFVFAGLLLMPSLIYGVEVMRGVIQEKTDRVVEILISSMKPMHLLSGKILGLAAVGLTQLAVWLTIAGFAALYTGGMMATADFNILQFLRPEIFIYFFIFFILGYMARIVRNVVAGVDDRLPEWDDLGEMFVEGVKLFAVAFLWYLPIFLVMVPLMVWAIMFDEFGSPRLSEMFAGCMVLTIVPLALLITFVLPAALVRASVYRTVGAGLAIGPVFAFVRDNFVNFLLAFIVYLAASFIGQMGVVIFCVGVIFTSFWGLAVTAHAYGQTWAYGKQN